MFSPDRSAKNKKGSNGGSQTGPRDRHTRRYPPCCPKKARIEYKKKRSHVNVDAFCVLVPGCETGIPDFAGMNYIKLVVGLCQGDFEKRVLTGSHGVCGLLKFTGIGLSGRGGGCVVVRPQYMLVASIEAVLIFVMSFDHKFIYGTIHPSGHHLVGDMAVEILISF